MFYKQVIIYTIFFKGSAHVLKQGGQISSVCGEAGDSKSHRIGTGTQPRLHWEALALSCSQKSVFVKQVLPTGPEQNVCVSHNKQTTRFHPRVYTHCTHTRPRTRFPHLCRQYYVVGYAVRYKATICTTHLHSRLLPT